MKKSNLHYRYIKKNLSDSEKKEYRSLLKKDSEFRADSEDLKGVYKYLNKRFKKVTVPDIVTNELFQKVGIKQTRKQFKWRYLTFLLILPLLLFLFSENFYNTIFQSENLTKSVQLENSNAPVSLNKENKKHTYQSHQLHIENQLNENDAHTNMDYDTSSTFEDREDKKKHEFISQNQMIENSSIASSQVVNKFDANIIPTNSYPGIISNSIKILNKLNISIELSSAPGWYSSPPIIESKSTSQIENFEYVFLYNINENFRIGLLYKNELLFTDYAITNDINTFYYYKYVELNSYGLVFEYQFKEIYNRIAPFVRLGTTYSKNAITIKEMLGLKFSLYEDFYMKIGVESNQHFYKALNENKMRTKYNINLGVGLNI